jgi:hypothetical protein
MRWKTQMVKIDIEKHVEDERHREEEGEKKGTEKHKNDIKQEKI